MKILIVEDEAPARRRLARMVSAIPGVTVAAAVQDADEARKALAEHRPDLVLLDIEMPEEDGLSLAATTPMPAVVFVTAHDQHAIRAFELAALDYVLKPVSQPRLAEAIERARSRAAPVDLAQTLRTLIEAPSMITPRVTARSGSTMRVFDARQIERFIARDKYTVFVHDGREYILDQSMSTLEERLGGHEFVRVHRAELINLACVVAVHVDGSAHTVELRSGARARVARRLVAELKRRLGA